MKKLAKILVILGIVAAIAFIAKAKFSESTTAEGSLTLYGNVDIRQVSLGFRASGRIAAMALEEGDPVTSGQLLASLDTGPLEDNLALFNAQVNVAEATVAKLEAGTRPREIAQARAFMAERASALINTQQLLDRQLELAISGAASQQAADDSKAQHDEAEARLNSAREALALAEEGPPAEDIAIAHSELGVARAKVAQAERQLADAELMSPADGIILTRVLEPGAIVSTGASIYTLSLKAPVWVRSYISEPDLGRIRPGMEVEVITDSRPDQPYQGQIGFISPVAEFTPKSVETEDLRTDLIYRLRVIIKEPDDALRQGMPVTVHLPDA
jgi:HlyD family secretion protein